MKTNNSSSIGVIIALVAGVAIGIFILHDVVFPPVPCPKPPPEGVCLEDTFLVAATHEGKVLKEFMVFTKKNGDFVQAQFDAPVVSVPLLDADFPLKIATNEAEGLKAHGFVRETFQEQFEEQKSYDVVTSILGNAVLEGSYNGSAGDIQFIIDLVRDRNRTIVYTVFVNGAQAHRFTVEKSGNPDRMITVEFTLNLPEKAVIAIAPRNPPSEGAKIDKLVLRAL